MNLLLPPDVMAGLMDGARVVDFYYLYAEVPLVLGTYLSLRGFSATAPSLAETGAPPANPTGGRRRER